SVDLGEHLAAGQLERPVASAADQLVRVLGELRRAVADRLAALEDEQLGAERLPFDDGEDDAAATLALEPQQPFDQGRRSTKTSISPPQGSPTAHASSSEIPYESSFGSPVSSTSRDCSKTSPSTQPPETEPHRLPLSEMARLEPTGRGAERRLLITVATTTRSPACCHCSISERISCTLRLLPAD